jgi:hypothetical protein
VIGIHEFPQRSGQVHYMMLLVGAHHVRKRLAKFFFAEVAEWICHKNGADEAAADFGKVIPKRMPVATGKDGVTSHCVDCLAIRNPPFQ